MIGPSLLLLVLIAVGLAVAGTRNRHPLASGGAVTTTPTSSAHHVPVVAEALGYIGGILGTVGVVLFASRYWSDAATATRLGIAGTATGLLVVSGAMVHEHAEPALARLRSTLWLGATAAAGVFAGVMATRVFDVRGTLPTVAAVAGAIAAVSGALWAGADRPVQQAVALGALCIAAGTGVTHLADGVVAGVAVWSVGAALVMLGIAHRTTTPALTLGIGAVATMAGTLMIASDVMGVGFPLACLDAGVLIALAAAPTALQTRGDRVVCAAVGALGLLQSAPQTVVWFAGDAGVLTGLVMWVLGASMMTVAIVRRLHGAVVLQASGGLLVLGGAAVTGVQSVAVATLVGVVTALGFIALGMLPGRVLLSMLGSLGLLVFVPWTIAHWFPGEDRAPLLITVCGALLVGIAVLLARQGGRLRHELTGAPEAPMSERGAVDVEAEEHAAERLVEPR